ncbi:MAG: hypothetical protein H0W12_04085 [Chitinophagaceae bacterium]|nr:hypothetical protein [Chitinophagaceae bacterium]
MLKTESYKKGIIQSTALNIFTKFIAFFITIVIAFYLGANVETDLYFYIFSTASLIAAVVNGLVVSVIIPEGMHLEEKVGHVAAMRFYNFFGLLFFALGFILFLVLFFYSVPLFTAVSAFNSKVLNQHRYLLTISSALPFFLILSNYLTSVLTTLKYFTAPLIANGIAYILALVSLVIFHKIAGISAALTGLVAGYILNVILLLAFMFVKLKWKFSSSIKDLSKRIKTNLLTVLLGSLASFAFNYGVIVLLICLAPGTYSAYNYTMQVVNVPIVFIVTQTAAVAGIKFNELASRNLHIELNKIYQESIGLLLFLIIPFCFITYLYADVIVNFLFLRGGFTTEAAHKVALFLKYMIFLVPCLTIDSFTSKIITAQKKVREAFYFQLGFNVVLFAILLVATRYYVEYGFIFSYLLVYYIYVCVAGIFLFRWLVPFIMYKNVLKSFAGIMLFNIPVIVIYYFIFGIHQPVPILILITFAYYLIIVIANHFIKINRATSFHLSNILKLKVFKPHNEN